MISTEWVDYMLHGRTIRLVRVAKGMSQDQLAQKIGVTYAYVSKIENGERLVTQRFERRFRELFIDEVRRLIHSHLSSET